MNILKLYEEEWSSRRNNKFEDYPRNIALKEFIAPVNNKKALDVGCGNGLVSGFLKECGYEVSAIDVSSEAILQVKKREIKKAIIGNVEERLPFKPSTFDLVFWGDNIEHVIFPGNVLSEIRRVLKSKGRLVISTPNIGFLLFRWHYFKTGDFPGTEGFVSDPWEWKHIRFFNQNSLKKLLHKKGFEVSQIKGASSHPLYKYLLSFSVSFFSPILIVEAIKK